MTSFVIILLCAQVATVTSLGHLAHRQHRLHTARSASGQSSLGNLRGLSRDETDDIFRKVGVESHQAAVLTRDQSRFGSPFLAPLLQARGREGLKLGDGAPHIPIGDRCTQGGTQCFSNSDCINGVCSCPRGLEEPGFPLLGCKGNSIADQLLGDHTGLPVTGGVGGIPGGGNSKAVGIGGICNDDRNSGRLTFCLDSSLCIRQPDQIKRCVCSQGFTRLGNRCVNNDELTCTLDTATSPTTQIAYVDNSSNRTTSCSNGQSACTFFSGAQCGTVPRYGRVCCVPRRFNDPSITYLKLNAPCDENDTPSRCQGLSRCLIVKGTTNDAHTCQCDIGYTPIFIGSNLECRHTEYLKCETLPGVAVDYAILLNNSPKLCSNNQKCFSNERCGISPSVIGNKLVCCGSLDSGGVAGQSCTSAVVIAAFNKLITPGVTPVTHPTGDVASGLTFGYTCPTPSPKLIATCKNGLITFDRLTCTSTPTTGTPISSACSVDALVTAIKAESNTAPFDINTNKSVTVVTALNGEAKPFLATLSVVIGDVVRANCEAGMVADTDPLQTFQKFTCATGGVWTPDSKKCTEKPVSCSLGDAPIISATVTNNGATYMPNGMVRILKTQTDPTTKITTASNDAVIPTNTLTLNVGEELSVTCANGCIGLAQCAAATSTKLTSQEFICDPATKTIRTKVGNALPTQENVACTTTLAG